MKNEMDGFKCEGLCEFTTRASTVMMVSVALRSVASRLGQSHNEYEYVQELVEILYNLAVPSREELAMQKGRETLEGGK